MAQSKTKSKGETRLNAQLDVATELFLEQGYEAVSIDEIISRAGGSRRNIYDSFGGKEGLFQAAISKLCGELTHPIDEAIDIHGELESNLHSLGVLFVDISLNERTLALHRLMVAEGRRFPELAQAIYQSGRGRGADAVAPLIDGNRNGVCKSLVAVSSRELADMFVSLVINETQIYALIALEPAPALVVRARERVRDVVQLFINGITHRS